MYCILYCCFSGKDAAKIILLLQFCDARIQMYCTILISAAVKSLSRLTAAGLMQAGDGLRHDKKRLDLACCIVYRQIQ